MTRGRVLAASIAFVATLGCDSGGPSSAGGLRFAGTVDGADWVPDTIVALAFAAPNDTSLVVTAARRVSPDESEEITVFLDRFRTGQFVVADTTAAAVGAFSVTQIEGDSAVGFTIYRTTAQTPGLLTVTGLARSDSTVAGSFSFEATSDPDTLPHRHITGRFRARYSMQPVFVP